MKEINPPLAAKTRKLVAIGLALFAAILFLTFAYFVGLFALAVAAFWFVWGFVVTVVLTLWGWLVTLFAGTWLVGLIATITGWITSFFVWFSATWLGSIFVPIYQLVFPIFAKVAPFFSVGSSSTKLMKWFKKYRKRGQKDLQSAVHKITKNKLKKPKE